MMDLTSLSYIGSDLRRPECVLATSDGLLHVSDWDGGVVLISPDGTHRRVLASGPFKPKPNGIAVTEDGWLIAHLGDETGGVFHLRPTGDLNVVLAEIDGVPLPPTNYVHQDGLGRVWITVSTRQRPRSLGYRPTCDDGFVILVDDAGARIVADRLGYTNECLVHPGDGRLYLNETFGRRLTRFDIQSDGSLTNRTTVTEFGPGTFPDGLTFDVEGGIWITSIVSNRIIRVGAEGQQSILLEDTTAEHLEWVEAAYQSGEMGRPHLDQKSGQHLMNISSLAFAGPRLKTAVLGNLAGDRLPQFEAPVAGLPMPHWHMRPMGTD